jgi:hypothetical protein
MTDPRDLTYEFRQIVIVSWLPFEEGDRWHAVYIEGPNGMHQMFEGSRDEAIAWARERCDTVKVMIKDTEQYELV